MHQTVKQQVDAQARSVVQLLGREKYRIDFYQREYRWGREHIEQLLDDLESRFLDAYDEGHDRKEVHRYPHYFLGSVIISQRDAHNYIIDGQQRLTSLTLLLISLHHLQREHGIPDEERVEVQNMISSVKYGERSFNLMVPERRRCMEALYKGEPYDDTDQPESVRNIVARYTDIEAGLREVIKKEALPYFVDWLKENVDLVQITTYSDEEAYALFEAMNDRGLRLNQAEMLKGYLLAKIKDPDRRVEANDLWKRRILQLIELGKEMGKEEELDFFKAWLRAKHADSIRQRRRGAVNKDFEKIGTEFHKWVRQNEAGIGLEKSADFSDFVMRRFDRFAGQYIRVREAGHTLTPGLEVIFYNAYVNMTLQYPLALAPLRVEDDLETIDRKIRLVGTFIDIFAARRIVNFRTLRYSSIVYTMFNLMKKIRDLDVPDLADVLKAEVSQIEETFDGAVDFYLHGQNRRNVHYLLARITHHIEEQCGIQSSFEAYVSRHIKNPFQIEHIWANRYRRHSKEFDSEADFVNYRNRLGGLLLLPRGFNQSYGDRTYTKKLEHYYGHNLLAKSLHPKCYKHNPAFKGYIERTGLPLEAHAEFKKADLDARQELYRQICEEIWSPDRLDREAADQ